MSVTQWYSGKPDCYDSPDKYTSGKQKTFRAKRTQNIPGDKLWHKLNIPQVPALCDGIGEVFVKLYINVMGAPGTQFHIRAVRKYRTYDDDTSWYGPFIIGSNKRAYVSQLWMIDNPNAPIQWEIRSTDTIGVNNRYAGATIIR